MFEKVVICYKCVGSNGKNWSLYNDYKCVVIGYRYGIILVSMFEDDKLNMKYKAEKCLKALGFIDV